MRERDWAKLMRDLQEVKRTVSKRVDDDMADEENTTLHATDVGVRAYMRDVLQDEDLEDLIGIIERALEGLRDLERRVGSAEEALSP